MMNSWTTLAMVISPHPGHGSDGGSYSLIHYLTEPAHAVTSVGIIAAVAAGIVGFRYMRRRLTRRAGWRAT